MNQSTALQILNWQLQSVLFLSLLACFMTKIEFSFSILIGASINILSTGLFAWVVFSEQNARSARCMLKAFYRGETLKLICAVLLFVVAFQSSVVIPFALFLGLLVSQLVYWFALWRKSMPVLVKI